MGTAATGNPVAPCLSAMANVALRDGLPKFLFADFVGEKFFTSVLDLIDAEVPAHGVVHYIQPNKETYQILYVPDFLDSAISLGVPEDVRQAVEAAWVRMQLKIL